VRTLAFSIVLDNYTDIGYNYYTYYELDSNNIISETTYGNTIRYYYGNGGVVGFRYNGRRFYYEKNLQGDIIGIYDEDASKLCEYICAAWGNCTIENDVSDARIGEVNSFRYRGYYFDSDIGLYYLKSRYYDAAIGRFINADGLNYLGANGDLGTYNLFAYCSCNPINMSDSSGKWPQWIKDAANWVDDNILQPTKEAIDYVYHEVTDWHFEDRIAKNGTHPSYSEVNARNSGWYLLPEDQSIYHDNGVGKPELKYITNDGREAVFDGDTLEPIVDPKYMATYNYCPIYQMPSNGAKVSDYAKLVGSYIGHGFADVLPYYLTGHSNTREQFESTINYLYFGGTK